MIGWAIAAVYVAIAIPLWRRIAWVIAHEFHGVPDGEDIAFGIFMGFYVGIAWPLSLPIWGLWLISRGGGGWLKEPKTRRTQAERIRALEARNAELERELGIAPRARVGAVAPLMRV